MQLLLTEEEFRDMQISKEIFDYMLMHFKSANAKNNKTKTESNVTYELDINLDEMPQGLRGILVI